MKKLISVFVWLFLVVPAYGEAPIVELETNFGDIVIELFDANAPGNSGKLPRVRKIGVW
jgi:hypothetical protein